VARGCNRRAAELLLARVSKAQRDVSSHSTPAHRTMMLAVRQMSHMGREVERLRRRVSKRADFTMRAMDRIDMTCPCDVQYRISATVYSETMKPLHVINDVKPRLDYRYTFVDIPGMVNNTCYKIFSYICIAQGTLGRDDCSPAKIDDYCTSFPPNAYPPPSPPPFPPYVDGTPPTGGLGEFLTGDGGGITRVAAEPEYQGKRWDPFYPPGREGECPPPLKGPNYGNWYTYADGNGLG